MPDGTIKIYTELITDGLKSGLAGAAKLIAGAAITKKIADMGAAAIKTGIEFESAFAGIIKTVDATDGQLSRLRESILGMTREIPQSAAELASIGEAAGQLGIKTENIEGFIEAMANLGVATNMSSEEAATSLARLANITGMPQTEFERLGSTVVALGNNLATTESEIVAMSLRIAGAGKQVGLTEAEIMSFSGALSSVGIEAEAGGTAFSTLISKMSLAAAQGGEDLKNFASVSGMSASEFKAAFEKDAAGAIQTFIVGLGKINKNGGSAIKTLDEMGLSDIRMRDALLRASGASDVFTKAIKTGTKAWKDNVALAKEAAQRYDTVESKIDILQNGAKELGIALYDSVQEPIKSIVEYGAQMLNTLTDAFSSGGIKGLAKQLGSVFADLVSHVADLAVEILPGAIEAGIQLLSGLLQGFAQALPGLIPAAAEALIDAIVSVVTNLDTLLEAGAAIVMGLLEGIVNAFPAIIEGVQSLVQNIFGLVSDSAVQAQEALDDVRAANEELATALGESNQKIQDQKGAIDGAYIAAQPWIERLDELEKKTHLTKQEQDEWNILLGKLSTAIPGVTDLVNLQTGEIYGGVRALRDYIGAWKDYAIAEVYAERSKEDIVALVDAQEKLSAAEQTYANNKAEYNTAVNDARRLLSQLNAEYGLSATSLDDFIWSMQASKDAMTQSSFEASESGARLRELQATINSLGGDTNNLSLSYDNLGGVSGDLQAQMDTLRTQIGELDGAIDKNMETSAKYTESAQEMERAAKDAAGTFQLSTGQVVTSTEEYEKAMKSMYVATKDATLNAALEMQKMGGSIDESSKEAIKTLLNDFSGLPADMDAAGKNILLGLIGGMKDEIPGLEDVSNMTAADIVAAIEAYLEIESPSRVMRGIGMNTIAGLKIGIEDNKNSVISSMHDIGTDMVSGMEKGINSKKRSLISTANGIASQITNAIKKAYDIHSPSRVMAREIGGPMALGIGVGFEDKAREVVREMQDAISFDMSRAPGGANWARRESYRSAPVSAASPTYSIVNNIQSPEPITVAEGAKAANRATADTFFRLGVAM